jgi:hypothetical protein
VRQRGRYSDVTSVLNGADQLGSDSFQVPFADNLYPGAAPFADLRTVPDGQVAVLARPYTRNQAAGRGVIVAARVAGGLAMADLVEKPDPTTAIALEERHGLDNLFLLEGRFRLTGEFRAVRSTPGDWRRAEAVAVPAGIRRHTARTHRRDRRHGVDHGSQPSAVQA